MTESELIQQSAEKVSDAISAEVRKLLVRAHVITFTGIVRDYKARRVKIDRLLQTLEAVLDAPDVGNDAWAAMEAAYRELTGK